MKEPTYMAPRIMVVAVTPHTILSMSTHDEVSDRPQLSPRGNDADLGLWGDTWNENEDKD